MKVQFIKSEVPELGHEKTIASRQTITCLKSIIKTLRNGKKYV